MKIISKALVIIVLVAVTGLNAQQVNDRSLNQISTTTDQIDQEIDFIKSTLRSALMKYFFRRNVNTDELESRIAQSLSNIVSYAETIQQKALQLESASQEALDLYWLKENAVQIKYGTTNVDTQRFIDVLNGSRHNFISALSARSYILVRLEALERNVEDIRDRIQSGDTGVDEFFKIQVKVVDRFGSPVSVDDFEIFIAEQMGSGLFFYPDEEDGKIEYYALREGTYDFYAMKNRFVATDKIRVTPSNNSVNSDGVIIVVLTQRF